MDLSRLKQQLTPPPAWLVLGAAACIIVIEAVLFLFPFPAEFPMDDGYIHFVYAENLAAQGKLFFSDPTETGLGTTSPLWVFLLAGLKLLGIPMPVSAKILGLGSLLILSTSIYILFRPVWKSPYLLLAVFLLVISGNLIWFSLSGMETTLFLALGALALLAYRSQKWIGLGVALGLTILARPEGVILAAAVGMVDLWAHRRIRREMITVMMIGAAIPAPWFIHVYLQSGYLLPSSAIGKRYAYNIGLDFVASQNPSLAAFLYLRNLTYPFAWFIYLMLFALGGKALPPPFLMEETTFGAGSYAPSVWAIPAWLLIVLPLLVAGSRWLVSRNKWIRWVNDPASRPLVLFGAWILLHNAAYMFFIPVLGTASRYSVMNHVALWILLAMGASRYSARPMLARALTTGLIVIAAANTLYWNRVYDSNIEHMRNVRIEAADYYRDSIPAGERCAVFDIGAIRYFSGRPIVDISGLTNPEQFQWLEQNKADAYVVEKGATCIILPGQVNIEEEGWIDFVKILGFNDSPYFNMQEMQTFEMDTDRWMVGYLPTSNQHRSVAIYRIELEKCATESC